MPSKFKRGDIIVPEYVAGDDIGTDMIILVLGYSPGSRYKVMNIGSAGLSYKSRDTKEYIEVNQGDVIDLYTINLKQWVTFPQNLYPLSLKVQTLIYLNANQ